MNSQLNRNTLSRIPAAVKRPAGGSVSPPSILHFGVGGFHRSHQAFYFQKLIDQDPVKNGTWSIVGACILPQDRAFVEMLKKQDCLYTLKSSSSDGKQEVRVIASIADILFGPSESEEIINRIASEETRIISFTITEGGYMLDETTGEFQISHPDIVADLTGREVPRTVFGYLSRGLEARRQSKAGKITLLSCDNVQENGQVLKQALLAFLQKYDQDLISYVEEAVFFPNSMVDRITPVTTGKDKEAFEKEFGYRDEGLVISEDFCQWIIEAPKEAMPFPALEEVGADLVKEVRPYEKMKLRILNGGHTLIGLLGKALGHQYIYAAVKEEQLSQLFDLYIREEVIPGLDRIEGVSFAEYMRKVKSRFENELILDTTDRIISFSSAKVPKFILPVIQNSLACGRSFRVSSLIIAAWWHYLKTHNGPGTPVPVEDSMNEYWEQLFATRAENSVATFLKVREVFGSLGTRREIREQVENIAKIIESEGMAQAIRIVLDSGEK